MSDVNPTRVDILSLSDDDFGSKYGRDRTAKEVATKNANDAAGYKAAEADFKKESKAEQKKMVDKLGTALDRAGEPTPKKSNFPLTTAAFEEVAKSDKERFERKAAKTGGGGGGSGGIKSMKYEPKTFKSGGKVSSASKRADGCAIKGKTKGRMV